MSKDINILPNFKRIKNYYSLIMQILLFYGCLSFYNYLKNLFKDNIHHFFTRKETNNAITKTLN